MLTVLAFRVLQERMRSRRVHVSLAVGEHEDKRPAQDDQPLHQNAPDAVRPESPERDRGQAGVRRVGQRAAPVRQPMFHGDNCGERSAEPILN